MKKKQTILITGTSTGFGNVTAKHLAKAGHTVFASMRDIHGRNRDKREQLLQWADKEHVNLHIVELDVTDDNSVNQLTEEVLRLSGGTIDVLINNAGAFGGGLTESFTVNDYKYLFDVNVFGSVRLTNAFLPHFRKQGHGLVVQVSSILGRVVIPFGGAYDATKFALEAINESLHYELKPLGVDISIVQPGPFATELVEKIYQPENQSIVGEYGLTAQLMGMYFENYMQQMSDPNLPNKPQDVADAMLQLVETANGQRPLRVVVDKVMAGTTEIINETSGKVQAGVLQNFGLTQLLQQS